MFSEPDNVAAPSGLPGWSSSLSNVLSKRSPFTWFHHHDRMGGPHSVNATSAGKGRPPRDRKSRS